jgi:hypothetical protein
MDELPVQRDFVFNFNGEVVDVRKDSHGVSLLCLEHLPFDSIEQRVGIRSDFTEISLDEVVQNWERLLLFSHGRFNDFSKEEISLIVFVDVCL